jgi:hypothetical protein
LDASLYELSQVPDADKKEYLEFRIPFLENIKKYLDNNSSESTPEGLRNKEFAGQICLSI